MKDSSSKKRGEREEKNYEGEKSKNKRIGKELA